MAGTANAASTAVADKGRTIRTRRKSAKKPDEGAEIVMVFLLGAEPPGGLELVRPAKPIDGSSLPIFLGSAISAAFIARLIKGCRVDAVPVISFQG